MKNDGQCWIHIPVDITDPLLSESAAQAINSVHAMFGKPTVVAGQRNPYYDVITQIGVAPGSSVDRSTPLAALGPINHLERVSLSLVDLVCAVDGDVEGLPVYFVFTADPATIDCPFSTVDPKEKWSEWGTFGESHKPVQLGGKWYRSSAVGESGALMNASWWTTLSRLNVISMADFQAVQQQNQVGP